MYHVYVRVMATLPQARVAIAYGIYIAVAAAIALIVATGALAVRFGQWPLDRHLMGAALMPLVLAFAFHTPMVIVNRATVFVGVISYGIYLIHPFVIALFKAHALTMLKGILPGSLVGIASIVAIFVMTLIVATVSYYGMERPLVQLGRLRGRNVRQTALAV